MGLEEKRRRRKLEMLRQMEEQRQQIKRTMEAKANDATPTTTNATSQNSNSQQQKDGRASRKESSATKEQGSKRLDGKSKSQWLSPAAGSKKTGAAPKSDHHEAHKKLMPYVDKDKTGLTLKEKPRWLGSSVTQKPTNACAGAAAEDFGSGRRDITEQDLGSPQSSVTFSQDPAMAVGSRKFAGSKNEASQDSFDFDASPPAASRQSRRRLSLASSSSDDSIDFKALAAKKFKSNPQNTGEKKMPPSQTPKRVVIGNETERANRCEGVASLASLDQADPPSSKKEQRQRVDEGIDCDISKKSPLNPLTQMREDMKAAATPAPASTLVGAAIDELWADPDVEEDKKDEDGPKKKRGKKKRCSDHQKKKPPKQSTGATQTQNYDVLGVSLCDLGEEDDCGKTNSELLAQLKPEFSHPVFGPFEQKPLDLSCDGGDGKQGDETVTYQVPASIARYLADYQASGVTFLFQAISTKKGCILGDDMGLGKTVQTVALVAALLGKRGTGEDLSTIHTRKREYIKREMKRREVQQQALRIGNIVPDSINQNGPVIKSPWWPILVMAPSSVMTNWETDFGTWGHFETAVYRSKDQYGGLRLVKGGLIEVLIVSHSSFTDKSHFRKLSEIDWKLVVIDEYHKFKNQNSHCSKNVRALKEQYDSCIVGLTGTVMQNNHEELWNLVDMAVPDFLGSWQRFKSETSNPIMLSRTKDATQAAIEDGQLRSEELSRKLYEIYLRRTKESELKEALPSKDERIIFCEPSFLQTKIYQHILQQPDALLVKYGHLPCDCGVNAEFFHEIGRLSSKKERVSFYRAHKNRIVRRSQCCFKIPLINRQSSQIDPRAVLWRYQHRDGMECPRCPWCIGFPVLNLLHKVSTHVALIQPSDSPVLSDDKKKCDAKKAMEIANVYIPDKVVNHLPGGSIVRNDSMLNDHFSLSGKMKVLSTLLKKINAEGGRVLVFSAYTTTLDLIECYAATTGYSFLRMDGSTATQKRKELADKFKKEDDIFMFLLSTKAMGLGLNLTSASWVIIFDVEWNPSYDAQAQDRAYRIGQSNNVKVFRLVARGTIEELRYLRQVYKTQLKTETIVDVEAGSEREASKRIFRAVDKDTDRRGELFGYINLTRFNPNGTFMDYGRETPGTKSHNLGGYDMASFLKAAEKMTEDIFDEEDTRELDNLNVFVRPPTGSSTMDVADDTQDFGAESQACLDIAEEMPRSEPGSREVKDKPVPSATKIKVKVDSGTSVQPSGKQKALPANVTKSGAVASKTAPTKTKRKGKSKHGGREMTTFSALDLALPSGMRKKRKRS